MRENVQRNITYQCKKTNEEANVIVDASTLKPLVLIRIGQDNPLMSMEVLIDEICTYYKLSRKKGSFFEVYDNNFVKMKRIRLSNLSGGGIEVAERYEVPKPMQEHLKALCL